MSSVVLLLGVCFLAQVCTGQSITPAPTGTFYLKVAQPYMTTPNCASILQLLFPSTRVYGRVYFPTGVLAIYSLFHDIRLRSRRILHHDIRCLDAITNALLGLQTK